VMDVVELATAANFLITSQPMVPLHKIQKLVKGAFGKHSLKGDEGI
jgi:hypothetical protein